MPQRLIPNFKNKKNSDILSIIARIGYRADVDSMDLTGFCKMTGDTPVYVFVNKRETVVLMLDWQRKPKEELADEEEFCRQPPLYFSPEKSRISPVWQLAEFTRQYKQIMIDAGVNLIYVWSVLITNSTIINYDDMADTWAMMDVTVYHHFGTADVPEVHYSGKFHEAALAQYKAFRLWCERQGDLPVDPYAFEDKDADYDEMEFGLDKDDNDIDCLPDEDEDDENDDNDLKEPDIDVSLFSSEDIIPVRKKVVHVEVVPPLSSPREELKKIVGCQNIKSQINDLLELTRYNNWMQSHFPEWKQHQVSLHAIFLGRPGTGKTTICKIYGGLLKEAGVLSKGHVVVSNRGTFIGSNWGDEESAIRQVLEKAKGGVLMIDEAYLLNSDHPHDPAKLILPQLMDILSNENERDLAIVLCGYKEPMKKLLELNPGLTSRFPNRFEFKDFSVDELLEITVRRIREHGYHFTSTGLRKYRALLADAYEARDPDTWGNARFVANLLEHIYLLHAKRCMRYRHHQSDSTFFSITPSDIQPIEVPKEKKHIGF